MSERVQRPLSMPERANDGPVIVDPPAELVRQRNALMHTARYAEVQIIDNAVIGVRDHGATQLRRATEHETRAAMLG